MESVLGRYRNLIVLVLVLFAQVLGLAVQVKSSNAKDGQESSRLIRIWAVGALSPFERGVVWIQNSSRNVWHNYFYLRGVRAENRELKQQIEQMRLEQVRLSEDAAQARRLQGLLGFKEQFIAKTVAAQVIGSSGSDLSRIVYIDKGEDSGIKRDMAVLTADGIVGKVLLVYPSESQVLLINDQSSGVGAILEKSRLQGVLRGAPNGEVTLERVMSDEQVQPGETVLTSGGDQIFPKGLSIGSVTKVVPGKDLFLNIKIKPAADLSKLEEVLVLVEKQERQSFADVHERVRAADILAQRLPSVPVKPAVDPNAPATASNPGMKPGTGATGAANGKPTTTAGVASKPTSGVTAQSPAKKEVVQGQQASGAASVTAATKAAKPKPVNSNPALTDSATVQSGPAIVEEKPSAPVSTQPKSQIPAEDNSPQ